MSNVPNPSAEFNIFKGPITRVDYLHLVQESDGSIPGWIDENGDPQGTLAIGGGGSGNIFINGSMITNPNFISGSGVSFSVVGSNVTISAAGGGGGVSSLNSLTGALSLVAGANVTITPSGGNTLTIASSGGVTSLNSLVGALSITPGQGINVAPSGSSIAITNSGVLGLSVSGSGLTVSQATGLIAITNTGVTSVAVGTGLSTSGSTGGITLANTGVTAVAVGAGLSTTGAAGSITLANTGVTSLNSLVGGLNITAGTGITVTPSGSNILITNTGVPGPAGAAGTSNVPWFDIQNYGGLPRQFAISQDHTTCTTTGGSPNVTLAAAKSFANGDGVVIWAAGAVCAIAGPPSAPVPTAPSVQGSATLNYMCVGVDSLGGLTAASANATVTNAPNIFGNVAVAISSISVTSNVCTVNFSSPINATAGNTIHITGVTTLTAANGVWPVASAPTVSSVTFAVTTANATGGVTSAFGRISNVAVITAISRAANGVVTITTSQPHNFVATGTSYGNQSILNVENVSPVNLNGEYVIASVGSTSIVCNTPLMLAQTGSVTAGQSTATCYEYVLVTCPAYAANTVAYYIYSDSPNPGGALTLIGKTLPGERSWKDWGPSYGGGYTAPGYVPTTAPGSSQNQLFRSSILSGAGSTSLVLTSNVTTGIAALGTSIVKDDSIGVAAAIVAAQTTSSLTGTVFLSPPLSPFVAFPQYIINYPITVPAQINIMFGCAVQFNETMTFAGSNRVTSLLVGAAYNVNPHFGIGNYCQLGGAIGGSGGFASPMLYTSGDGVRFEGLGIDCGGGGTNTLNLHNGQYGLVIKSDKTIIRDCFFASGNSGTAVGLTYSSTASGGSWHSIQDTQFSSGSVYVNGISTAGQSFWGPPVGNLNFHCSDTSGGIYPSNLSMYGNCSFSGRGILLDALLNTISQASYMSLGLTGAVEFQQPSTPSLMFWSDIYEGVSVFNFLNDSVGSAIIANWNSNFLGDVWIHNSNSSVTGASAITGRPISLLKTTGNSFPTGAPQLGQNVNLVSSMGLASFTTSGATTDVITFNGASALSIVGITPTNAAAALDIAAGNVYVSNKTTGSVTITHGATSGMTFDILISVN